MKHTAAALLLCLVTLAASAQPVYRCGSVYAQTPCPRGKIVEATDPRTAAQRAEANRVATDERRLAAEMRRERLADQAALKPAAAASLSGTGTPPATPVSARERLHPKKKKRASAKATTGDFTAVDPSTRKQHSRK